MKTIILQIAVFVAFILGCGYVWACDDYEFDKEFEIQISKDIYDMCISGEFDNTPEQDCLGIFMDDMKTIDELEQKYLNQNNQK